MSKLSLEVKPSRRRSSILVAKLSDAGISDVLGSISVAETPTSDDCINTEQTLADLEFYYGLVKRHILKYQSPTLGLFPSNSAEKTLGSVRDTIYCCMSTWSLHQAYKKIDDNGGKAYELGQTTVFGLQGILYCWMRQSHLLEDFKQQQRPIHALHMFFDLDSGFEVVPIENYGHLQIGIVSLYLLFLVQVISSGLQVVSTLDEVAFIQNIVFYVERAYRTPDFGMWGIGSTDNNGTCEVHASSIGLAKAALESINGCNLFGENGAAWSVVYVDIDAHNRNRSIFETLLPRESSTKDADISLLMALSFPAFATHDESLYKSTKANIIENLVGDWGVKRFKRDGFGCVNEPTNNRFYSDGITQMFENIECEWPIFYTFLIVDGIFQGHEDQVRRYQKLLKRRLIYTEKGDPLLPQYYYVPEDNLADERSEPYTQGRLPSKVGSTKENVFLWGQAMLIISDVMASGLVSTLDVDPIRRALPSSARPKSGSRHSTFEKGGGSMNSMDSVVQVVLIAESRRLQASLNTYGIQTQTPEEIEPVQIWSQWDMVKVLERLGQNDRLGLSGRPVRPIGALGSSKVYRVSGQTVLCYPLIFSASEFYLSHDLALLIDDIRSDIKFICKRWRLAGRPTVCIVVTEDNMKNPQFPEMLQFLTEMKSHRIDNIKISLGRLQNLMSCACIEHLDFSFSIDLNELNIQPFAQVQHHHVGYTSLTEGPKLVAKEEEKRDFIKDFKEKPTNEIANTILKLDHLYGKIQLLGILLQRHGEDFMVGDARVKTHLEQLNRKAGSLRYWSAVRYSASLLKQMIDSISPYVTQILVNGKQVTVGTVGLKRCATFNKPMTPAEIHAAIYAEVQPFNIIGAVLQQELILYCGKLIATNPELFAGILKVRIGWILHALELYRGMTVENPEPLETCSPSRLRKLLLEVLSKSRAIHFSMTKPLTSDDVDPDKFIPVNPIYHIGDVDLTIYQVRQLSGCLIRVPANFYEDLWHILKKAPEGIYVGDYHLPQEPTISKMSCNELSFAHTVENMLNSYSVPVDKQIVIECLSVLGKILKRHPEIRLIDAIRVENLIDEASSMYFQDHKTNLGNPRDIFYRLSISHTSAYLGKAIIMSLLHGPNLTQFAVSAAASEFHCRVQ